MIDIVHPRKPFFEHFLERWRSGRECLYKYMQNTWLFKSIQSSETSHLGKESSWMLLKEKVRLPNEPELNQEPLPFSSKSKNSTSFLLSPIYLPSSLLQTLPFRSPLLIPLKLSFQYHPCRISEWCLPNRHWLHCHSHLPTTIPFVTLSVESRPEQSAQPERALTIFIIVGYN